MGSRILVTGGRGRLGRELVSFFSSSYDVTSVGIEECDVRDYRIVRACLTAARPEIVVHTAAYTDVDACESNQLTAMVVNAVGTENIARVCKEIGARMVYYSTDYVFDGAKDSAYVETDPPRPETVYGKSKLEGERRVAALLEDFVILRVGWLYGINGRNFVKTIVRLGLKQLEAKREGRRVEPLKIVEDQIGNPTWTVEVAGQTKVVIEKNLTGLFHCSSAGETSRYRFARDILDHLSLDVEMKPCRSDEFTRPARRPKRSSLENKRLKEAGADVMRDYKTALENFLNTHGEALLQCNAI